jgi:esterase/lipase
MKKLLLEISAYSVIIYAVICLALYFLQNYLIYYPQDRAIKDPQYTMHIQAEGADIVVTRLIRPGTKAVIYFGGNAEDVSLNFQEFQKQFPEYSLYLMHYRGYGGSTGSPSEEMIYQDALLLYEEVKNTHKEISVMGRSLGTGFAVHLASEKPIQKLVLVAPYDSMETIAGNNYPFIPVKLLLHEKFNSYQYAKKVTAPTTIIMAENDGVIPASSTKNLYANFRSGIAGLVVINGAEHNNISSNENYYSIVRQAI